MIYAELFWSMFQIGLLSIGGGYAAIPLIERQIVELHGWLTAQELMDIVTIAEMTPGPIAINAATFVGMRVAGVCGALVATLACVLPSCVIVLLLAKLYNRCRNLFAMQYALGGLRPAVVAMIASAGLTMLLMAFFTDGRLPRTLGDVDFAAVAIFAAGALALRKGKIPPIYVMVGASVVGLIAYMP